VLVQQFNSSYSASRAALLEAWKSFGQWRDWMTDKFCQPIYEAWFSEAVARGRITAPGFFQDPGRKKAYVKAQWYGPTQGQLDPVKEVEAANLRCQYGFSNRSKEAMELTGTDFRDNAMSLKRENELMERLAGSDGKKQEGET
jgi:capsid protein